MKGWRDIVKTVAPAIASAFGTPLAGVATRALCNALLGKDQASDEELGQAVAKADPETLLKLKQADQQFAVDMRKLDVDLDRIAQQDRDSARQREIKTGDKTPAAIATFVVVGFFGVVVLMVFAAVPPAAQQPLNILLGALAALLTQVANYYFGSSAGSAQKTRMLGNALQSSGLSGPDAKKG